MPTSKSTPILFDRDFNLIINGEKVKAVETIPILNPATKQPIADAPRASHEQLDTAVAAAKAAFPTWAATSWSERAGVLNALATLVEQHSNEFAVLLTKESGKPLSTGGLPEVLLAVSWLRDFAKQTLPEEKQEFENAESTFTKRYTPLGVCAAIVPWNFPLVLLAMKVGVALLTGNVLIAKPAPTTPLASLKFGELAQQVLPPGILTILSGGDELGPWITAHPGFAKVAFVGSTATGKAVLQSIAPRVSRVTLELGGNDPAIVMPDVDVNAVAEKLFWTMFYNAGQMCIGAKRVYIHADIYESMRDRLVAIASGINIGDGLNPETHIGPLQNAAQYQKVKDFINDCRAQNFVVHEGGNITCRAEDGFFIPFHIVDNPPDDARIVQEEPFGPICPLLKWTDEDDVIQRANDTDYGLAASIWCKNTELAKNIARRLESGVVGINQQAISNAFVPFGGHKMSGLGVDGGHEGLLGWVNVQMFFNSKAHL